MNWTLVMEVAAGIAVGLLVLDLLELTFIWAVVGICRVWAKVRGWE